jgi:hypothetical protein
MTSTTASAARVTRGFPAKVEPWSPGAMASATCCFTSTAPMGRPPLQTHAHQPVNLASQGYSTGWECPLQQKDAKRARASMPNTTGRFQVMKQRQKGQFSITTLQGAQGTWTVTFAGGRFNSPWESRGHEALMSKVTSPIIASHLRGAWQG